MESRVDCGRHIVGKVVLNCGPEYRRWVGHDCGQDVGGA